MLLSGATYSKDTGEIQMGKTSAFLDQLSTSESDLYLLYAFILLSLHAVYKKTFTSSGRGPIPSRAKTEKVGFSSIAQSTLYLTPQGITTQGLEETNYTLLW